MPSVQKYGHSHIAAPFLQGEGEVQMEQLQAMLQQIPVIQLTDYIDIFLVAFLMELGIRLSL